MEGLKELKELKGVQLPVEKVRTTHRLLWRTSAPLTESGQTSKLLDHPLEASMLLTEILISISVGLCRCMRADASVSADRVAVSSTNR